MPQTFPDTLEAWTQDPCPPRALDVLTVAEQTIGSAAQQQEIWHHFLDITRLSAFLSALPDREHRNRWAEICLQALDSTHFTLETLLDQRTRRHPDRILFQERDASQSSGWSYAQVRRRARRIAAGLLALTDTPRVAIFADNGVDSACTDLACLAYDILDTPLNVHFDTATLTNITERLAINIVVTDSDSHYARWLEVRQATKLPFRILRTDNASSLEPQDTSLGAIYAPLGEEEVEDRLSHRKRLGWKEAATVMFTSGSTGEAKGLVFSQRNLVSKRFARAAALPAVDEQEVLLCYLPLFHTFGRYLEMLGMLFWGGTYCFAGNPSAETLLTLLQKVRPTGLISIPLRWTQIHDHCLSSMNKSPGVPARTTFETETGGRLRWGLSAAGRLDPKVFRFFHKMGVELCSGFGMTEATGGITMTPPGEYRDGSVGIPLPLMRTRINDIGELHIGGPYVAHYLGDPPEGEDPWIATGDLFMPQADGHLEIVDRIKDIYKNSRGQTIAPGRVEQKFADVPGIKRVFLVGDGRDYNALLIVPDLSDPIMNNFEPSPIDDPDAPIRTYYRQIVSAANKDLAPYERVVNFTLVERDFSADQGELTAKGTYRRKTIQENFAPAIRELYRKRFVELRVRQWSIRIPRWFFRDLTELETDIVADDLGLCDEPSGRRLDMQEGSEPGSVRIGDLEYAFDTNIIDLGQLARQPFLWVSNAALVAFAPCKDGWDVTLDGVSPRVLLPWKAPVLTEKEAGLERVPPSLRLLEVHRVSLDALYGRGQTALEAAKELSRMLESIDPRTGELVRRRLEALARHPDLEVRCHAYQSLLLSLRVPTYDSMLRSFVQAGLKFLNEETIEIIAQEKPERRRLEAFRQRLHGYRSQLPWPAPDDTRSVFIDVFKLLASLARYHPEFYGAVREELVAWIMHEPAPKLAAAAERELHALAARFEQSLTGSCADPASWQGRIVFQDGLHAEEAAQLQRIIVGTSFLKQAIMLSTDEETCDIERIVPDGIWVSRISTLHQHASYRVSINTDTGKHYDLQIVIPKDISHEHVLRTIYWIIGIRGYPFGQPVLPKFGCWRPELGALALAYVSDLTVWERIRAFASFRIPGTEYPPPEAWRKLFVRAMAAFFAGWRASGRRIVPGAINPSNVAVPGPDFQEGTQILSLTDWKPYDGPKTLVAPLVRNFYVQTVSHYPWCAKHLDPDWILQACIEAIGEEEGTNFLRELDIVMGSEKIPGAGIPWHDRIEPFLSRLQTHPFVPLAVSCAEQRYHKWQRENPDATSTAKEQCVLAVQALYGFERFPAWVRFHLYAQTYFATFGKEVQDTFQRLIQEMARNPGRDATSLIEVSDLQAWLESPEDRAVFNRAVFPKTQPTQPLEFLAVRHGEQQKVILQTKVFDVDSVPYCVREPLEPSEVGKLYRHYVTAGFHKTISTQDHYLVLLNETEQIVGGLSYRRMDDDVVHLDGIVVSGYLRGRGLNGAMLEDFCARMVNEGTKVIRTHFFVRHFYMQRG
ncbi:MAG TPA: GNAT family N-acetyltransferase, partial [Polyangiaceae bacterium]|nr:GNAT family N-acetyltransferase [Polyangiaceae bacterium]